jgi:hypothetical protein
MRVVFQTAERSPYQSLTISLGNKEDAYACTSMTYDIDI